MNHPVPYFFERTNPLVAIVASGLTVAALSACAPMERMYSQDSLADNVKVPAGNRVAMQTVGVGEILYECRARKDMAGQFEWTFIGPDAVLNDRHGVKVGKYYGPPATWESLDGSKLTATQVAVAPAGSGNIPHQLVKANPASGSGTLSGTTYIQRVATVGGVAPSATCEAGKLGARQTVRYQADYIFWKAA